MLGGDAQAPTAQRRHVLAHELAHVLQYRGTAKPGGVEIGAPDSAAEAEADVAGERVLVGHTASVTARDAAPVVRRMLPRKECSNDEHALLIGQWMVRLQVWRELLKDAKYDNVRAAMGSKLTTAEALLKGYQKCGRVKDAPATGIVGFVSTPPVTTPVGPVWSPAPAPVVAPEQVFEPAPVVIETPAPEAPMGMGFGAVGPAIAVQVGIGLIQWLATPSPTGMEIEIEDLKQVMAELEKQWNALRQAVEAVTKAAPQVAPSPKVIQKRVRRSTRTPTWTKTRSPKTKSVRATSKTARANRYRSRARAAIRSSRAGTTRCADSVTISAYKGKDVCISGKAFDAVDASGALWEIKAHAWSYATIYQDPEMRGAHRTRHRVQPVRRAADRSHVWQELQGRPARSLRGSQPRDQGILARPRHPAAEMLSELLLDAFASPLERGSTRAEPAIRAIEAAWSIHLNYEVTAEGTRIPHDHDRAAYLASDPRGALPFLATPDDANLTPR